jgi:small subunit ribosomal protein S5
LAKEQQQQNSKEAEPLQDRVVHIARVAKVVKGGRRFSFSALIAVGDGKDRVGFGLGKAGEVPDAIKKASDQARKSMVSVPKVDGTIPFEVVGKYGSCKVLMYPGKKGNGIIAGGAVRILVELCGITDIVCKVHGTKNPQNVVKAVLNGLQTLVPVEQLAASRGKALADIHQKRESK